MSRTSTRTPAPTPESKKHTTETGQSLSSNTELLTISEVARALRVDDTTARRWAKLGVLEVVILPHANARQAYRVKRETLEKILTTSYDWTKD